MRKLMLFALISAGLAAALAATPARADHKRIAHRWHLRHSMTQSWHGNYYHTSSGYPEPLVVPPTANTQTYLGWGVTQTEVRPIHHQFRRPYPGYMESEGGGFLPTPYWPSHTDQLGVYYIRGPW
jgi:hypothetical protein